MITAFVTSLALQTFGSLDSDKPVDFAWIMIITVSVTTVVWLAVTFATQPESKETLVSFYRRARPGIIGWRPVARMAPEVKADSAGVHNLLDWICGCILIYGFLFGTGKLLLGETGIGLGLLALALAGGAVIYFDLSRRGWSKVTG
jgi:solute:Na+ symporter, SSS family